MAHYDEDTQRFMDRVSGSKEEILRQAVGFAKDIAKRKPVGASIAKRVLGAGTHKLLEKTGGVSTLQLFATLTQDYGEEWRDWEPETIWQTLEVDHGISPSDELRNMIQAVQVVAKTDAPFENWHVFEKVGHAFCENMVSFSYIQPLELDEVAWTLKALLTIRPKAVFEEEIKGYIAACAKKSGVVYLPQTLFIAGCQEALDELNNDLVLAATVKSQWPVMPSEVDAALGVQLARLKEVQDYVARRANG
jgi:hypothetical protein